jgi:hypothetical protein
METKFAYVAGMFKTNTDIVNGIVSQIQPDDWFRKPGDDSNHLLWVVGHLSTARGSVVRLLGGEWSDQWTSLFTRGAKPAPQTDYPSAQQILDRWNDVSAKLSSLIAHPPGELMSKPAPDGPPSFDGKVSGTVAFLAFHETYHVGQVAYLKKWLGYGQTVG